MVNRAQAGMRGPASFRRTHRPLRLLGMFQMSCVKLAPPRLTPVARPTAPIL